MIFIVLIFGLILRLISINQSFWIDEATSALTTKMNLADFFGKFMPGDFHPPLYYVALRLWAAVFGNTEIALRSMSIVFALLTIYLTYLIGKELVNKKVGIIAALLLATSGLHIYYSQEARMYAMSTFLVALTVYFFTKILHKSRGGDWIVFGTLWGVIGLTDYLPLLILPVFWIYVVLTNRKLLSKLFVSHIILGVFALLWSPIFIKQLSSGINVAHTSPSWVAVLGTFSIKDILLIPIKFALGRVGFESKFVYAGVVGFVFLIFGFLLFRSIRLIKQIRLFYLWLLVPFSLALIISIKLPILNYFRFIFLLPAFYLIIASGVKTLNKKGQVVFLGLIIAINLVSSFMYLGNQKFQREDWRSAVSYIEHNKIKSSAVIFPANSQMEAYHYYAPQATIYGPEAIKNNYSEVWLIRYAQPISDPNDTTRLRLEGFGYKKAREIDFNGVVVWRYTKI
jgi:mannosyltransferase